MQGARFHSPVREKRNGKTLTDPNLSIKQRRALQCVHAIQGDKDMQCAFRSPCMRDAPCSLGLYVASAILLT